MNTSKKNKFSRIHFLLLFPLMFLSTSVFGQKVVYDTTKAGVEKELADRIWSKTYPNLEGHISPFYQTSHHNIFSKSKLLYLVSREEYGLELRKWGLKFWKNFPNDPRRFKWLEKTAVFYQSPRYYKDIEEGARDEAAGKWNIPIDTEAYNSWKLEYANLTAEYLASSEVSEDRKQDFLYSQIFSEILNLRNSFARGGQKLDIRSVLDKIERIAPYWENIDSSSKPRSDGGLFKKGGTNQVSMLIILLVRYLDSYGLSINDLKDALMPYIKSPYSKLSNVAREQVAVLKLSEIGFKFKHTDVTGNVYDLDKMSSKLVLLDFWSTGCSVCIAKMPEINEVYKKYKDNGFEVLSIATNSIEAKDDLLKIYDRIGAKWPLFIIGGSNPNKYQAKNSLAGKIWEEYGFQGVPQLILLDKDRKMIYYNGDMLFQKGFLEKIVKERLIEN